MILDLIEDFASLVPYDYLPTDYNIWYIGIDNSIDKGINDLLSNLKQHGHIIINEPEIVSYVYKGLKNQIIWVVLYKSLSNLEYLEYKVKEKEDKNEH